MLEFGKPEIETLVRQVVYRLQRIPASGIYGDDYGYKTLWDEYCHEVQEGPFDLLDNAWDQTLGSTMDNVIDRIPQHMALLLSQFSVWEFGETDQTLLGAVWPDGIRSVLRDRLSERAGSGN